MDSRNHNMPCRSEANHKLQVKSSVVVKHCLTQAPADYSQLAHNTNINSPPPNWLRGKFRGKRDQEPWIPWHSGSKLEPSSIVMANTWLDNVGKVDVISDAQNIKSLLKMPYSGAPISMMVNRIGKTLLIDNFNAYDRSMRFQKSDWKWLRSFVRGQSSQVSNDFDSSGSSFCEALVPVVESREDVKEKLMLSKFLYHSVVSSASENECENITGCRAAKEAGFSVLPDPLESEPIDDQNTEALPNDTSKFEREILWTFEDIRMLIGTDMPIFGGGTQPCVSLRLKDMKKPINILTGLDYWLDNLMCNVPEVVMCYHLEGIVQKYELIKTEDLPKHSDVPFSPAVVRDVAQNVLSFLKSNATKEGHTYWLFKGKDDDVVKLYDLTTVCPEHVENVDVNPFTLPVAVLMYKVARNLAMKHSKNLRKTSNTIYKLLNDCLELLDKEKTPQVVGSVHYLMCFLYISCGNMMRNDANQVSGSGAQAANDSVPAQPTSDSLKQKNDNNRSENNNNCFKFTATGSEYSLDEFNSDDDFDSLDDFDQSDWIPEDPMIHTKTKTLEGRLSCVDVSLDVLMRPVDGKDTTTEPETSSATASTAPKGSPWLLPKCSNFEDCCKEVLEHVYEGLECAEVVERYREKQNTSACFSDEPETSATSSDPQTPIPLAYQPLFGCTPDPRVLPLAVCKPLATTWQLELTALLMAKAMTAYFMLADCCCKLELHGKALRNAKLSLLCYESAKQLVESVETNSVSILQVQDTYSEILPGLLQLCGDIHFSLAKNGARFVPKHKQDFSRAVYRDTTIANKAWKIIGKQKTLKFSKLVEFEEGAEMNLLQSVECYESADVELLTRANDSGFSSAASTASAASTRQKPRNLSSFQSVVVDSVAIKKRLGNSKNELGLHYMELSSDLLREYQELDKAQHRASCSSDDDVDDNAENVSDKVETESEKSPTEESVQEQVLQMWEQSWQAFMEGIEIFDEVNDKENKAFLNSNAAKLMRLRACAYMNPEKKFSSKERQYLEKAVHCYQNALECVTQKSNATIWETMQWDYSSTLFQFATQLQDRPPLSMFTQEEIESEICKLMQKSLRIAEDIDFAESYRHDVYVYRMASIHHKLASMYSRSFMLKNNDNKRKISELHYTKAYSYYKELVSECPLEFVRVQLERVALLDYQAEHVAQSQSSKQVHYLQQALKLCMELETVFPIVSKKLLETNSKQLNRIGNNVSNIENKTTSKTEGGGINDAEARTLCELTMDRLRNITLSIKKILSADAQSKKIKKPADASKLETFTRAYAATLYAQKPIDAHDWSTLVSDSMKRLSVIFPINR